MHVAWVATKWLALLVCAIVLGFVLINLRDEELTSEAHALLEPPAPVEAGSNGYLFLVGFDSPEGVDPLEEGKRIVAEHNAAVATPGGWWGVPYRSGDSPGRLKFAGDSLALCSPLAKRCFADASYVSVDPLFEQNAIAVARYRRLLELPGFAVSAEPSLMQPMMAGLWSPTRMLLLSKAARDIQSGNRAEALSFVESDVRFWRRVLAGSGSLVSDMIAVRIVADDCRFLSELIAMPAFRVDTHVNTLRSILHPLTTAERSASRALRNDFSITSSMVKHLIDYSPPVDSNPEEDRTDFWTRLWGSKAMIALALKPNASINFSARYFTRLTVTADGAPARFDERSSELAAYRDELSRPGISWIYNPAGRTLVSMALPNYDEYVARMFDLAAYIQLVRAQLEMRIASPPSASVSQFPQQAGDETRNPYTLQPFQWDAATRRLLFESVPRSRRWKEWNLDATVPLAQ